MYNITMNCSKINIMNEIKTITIITTYIMTNHYHTYLHITEITEY